MSILNHSIPSNGQPLLPARGSAPQDACQHLSMVQSSSQGAHSMKPFQSNSSKKGSLVIASRDHHDAQGESISMISNIGPKKEGFQNCILEGLKMPDMDFTPVAESFLCSFSDNEKFVRIVDAMGQLDHYISSKPNFVLTVSVSSAVKLDAGQIELIARKMQKLTGFTNLRIENTVDPSLIAGFTVSYGDDESNKIDLSVKGQLASLAARVESSETRIANNLQSWSSFPRA